MINKVSRLAALTCLCLPGAAMAADKQPFTLQTLLGSENFTIKAHEKLRYETYDNSFRPLSQAAPAGDMLTFRTTLELEYRGKGFKIGGELRDVRAYLNDMGTPVTPAEVNALEPLQAYVGVDLGTALGGKAELTAGRFMLNLGSRRLVGTTQFRMTGNGYTGLRLDWKSKGKGKESVTLFYTYPQQRLPTSKADVLDNEIELDRSGDDLVFWGGIVTLPKAIGGLTAELYTYVLNENDRGTQQTRNRHFASPGLRLFAKPAKGKLDGEFETILQLGSIRTSTAANAPKVDVSAYLVHGEIGYTLPLKWQPRLSATADIASGDHAASTSYNRFDPIFGTRRWEYGPTGIFGALHRSNVNSVSARFETQPNARMDTLLGWRHVWLDSKTDSFGRTGVVDTTGASGRKAGDQVEARLRYWLLPGQVQIDMGGAVLLKGPFLRDAPNAPPTGDSHYGYTDLTFFF